MTPQMIMRKPCCQMDLPKGICIRNIFLLNEIQADRENSHQCAIAVGIFVRFAAGCEVVAVAILIDGVAAGIPPHQMPYRRGYMRHEIPNRESVP